MMALRIIRIDWSESEIQFSWRAMPPEMPRLTGPAVAGMVLRIRKHVEDVDFLIRERMASILSPRDQPTV